MPLFARQPKRINPKYDPLSIYTDKEIARGFAIVLKVLILCFGIEVAIIILGMVSGYQFAELYGRDPLQQYMMMDAPIVYALIEATRVPLAIGICLPRYGLTKKLCMLLGLMLGMLVTIKTVSQMAELQFRPRMTEVTEARTAFHTAQAGATSVDKRIADANGRVVVAQKAADAANAQMLVITKGTAEIPKPVCTPISGYNKKTRRTWHSQRCTEDARIPSMTSGMTTATTAVTEANAALQAAITARNEITRTSSEKEVVEAEGKYRLAVMHSQIHSFTAMVFGKDPTDVTDAEVSWFLRLFIFIPSIGAAISATMLALSAVVRIKPRPTHVEIPDTAAHMVPEIIRRHMAENLSKMQAAVPVVETPTPAAQPAPGTEPEPPPLAPGGPITRPLPEAEPQPATGQAVPEAEPKRAEAQADEPLREGTTDADIVPLFPKKDGDTK